VRETVFGIFNMPKTMRQLALVQFFTWFALFSMWIYSTNAITSNIYDMKVPQELYANMKAAILSVQPKSENESRQINSLQNDIKEIDTFQKNSTDVTITINMANYFLTEKTLSKQDESVVKKVQTQYNDGADWLGVCSSVRNGVAAIFAFLIPVIAIRIGRKKTHMTCLIIGGLGLISLNFISQPDILIVSMAMVGIAWSSILSMPYAMLSDSLPANKMGYYMGVFNFFIVIPQIIAATVLGFFTLSIFNGNTMYTLVLGGAFMILAGILSLRVDDNETA